MSNSRASILLLLAATLVACRGNSVPPNESPVARPSVTPTSGPAPLTVAVSGSASSDADGTITGYSWTFGDGSSASGLTADHTYTAVGEFVITLTVTDDEGASSSAGTSVVATGSSAVYNGSLFDGAQFEEEPGSGTYDATVLQ
jgi:PKD repeat protein